MATRHKTDGLTGPDFTTGLIAALTIKMRAMGNEVIRGPRIAIEEAFVDAFDRIEELAKQKGVEVRFWLAKGRYRGGCELAGGLIMNAMLSGMLTNDFPGEDLRFDIPSDYAPRYFEGLALDPDDFLNAAQVFIDRIPGARARHFI